jgi:hypothetical protein
MKRALMISAIVVLTIVLPIAAMVASSSESPNIPENWRVVTVSDQKVCKAAVQAYKEKLGGASSRDVETTQISISIGICDLVCGSRGKGVWGYGSYTAVYAYVEGKYYVLLACQLFGCSDHEAKVYYDPSSFCYWNWDADIDALGRWAKTVVEAYAGPGCLKDSSATAIVYA